MNVWLENGPSSVPEVIRSSAADVTEADIEVIVEFIAAEDIIDGVGRDDPEPPSQLSSNIDDEEPPQDPTEDLNSKMASVQVAQTTEDFDDMDVQRSRRSKRKQKMRGSNTNSPFHAEISDEGSTFVSTPDEPIASTISSDNLINIS